MLYSQPKVKLETIFIINDDKTTKKEYLFKEVTGIFTDEANNFYVYENFGTEIRKFTKNGKYIKTIGRVGEGPGEFKSLASVYISLENELVVIDPKNRRISYFDLNGNYLRSIPRNGVLVEMRKVSEYNATSYLGLTNNGGVEPNETKQNMIMIYDKSLKNKLTSFAHPSIFWKFNDVFELRMYYGSWINLAWSNNRVYLSKEYYDGKIYYFDKARNWEVKVVDGKEIKKLGYEIIEKRIDQMDLKNFPGGGICFSEDWNGKRGIFTIIYKYSSIGLFIYKEKYLINFLIKYIKKGECEFGADIFDLEGKYIGYSKIESSNKVHLVNKVHCKDKEDNFYMKTNGEEIRKFKLTIE
jgi:hypothetical protein